MSEKETVKAPDPYPKADLTDFDSAELLGDNIVVQRWTPEEMSEGGIVLPSAAQASQAVGWVVKIGNRVPPGSFGIGDTVIFPQHAIQALPEVGGTDDASTHFTEYNYMRAEDVVLRYPLLPELVAYYEAVGDEPHTDPPVPPVVFPKGRETIAAPRRGQPGSEVSE